MTGAPVMTDAGPSRTESPEDQPAAVHVRPLRGANWFASHSVLVAAIGRTSPEQAAGLASAWPRASAILHRLLPPGLPEGGLPLPIDRAAAVEALVGAICGWGGFPPATVQRTPMGAAQRHMAGLAPGHLPLTQHATDLALRILALAAGDDRAGPDDAWIREERAALLARRKDSDGWLPSSRRYVVAAAERRGLAWLPKAPTGGVVQIGEGRHAQLFDGSSNGRSGAPGMLLAGNKRLANIALRQAGIPVARQRAISSLAGARAAMAALGLPIVIKPEAERRQAGVGFVFREDELEAVFTASYEVSQTLLAESYIPGIEHRALVIDGRIAQVIVGLPPSVTGDGRSTIRELIAVINADPRRGPRDQGFRLTPIRIDELSARHLARFGRSYDDVLAEGEGMEVYPLPMVRFGAGWKTDVTDIIHPDTAALVIRAATILDLDVAGVDLRTPDIARSWNEVGAGLCEVNPHPSLTVHYNFEGQPPREVADLLLAARFPAEAPHRMTHVAVIGDGDLLAPAQAIAATLRQARGWRVGIATPDLVDLEGWHPAPVPRRPFDRYAMVIADRTLDAAVHVMDPASIERWGLGCHRLDLALLAAAPDMPERQKVAVRHTLMAAGARVQRLERAMADPGGPTIASLLGAGGE